jgi:hypothetical protein
MRTPLQARAQWSKRTIKLSATKESEVDAHYQGKSEPEGWVSDVAQALD